MVEDIMARGHRRVGGEHRVARHQLQGAVEIQPLLHLFAAALQDEEGGVSFVDVPHVGVASDRAQGAHTADAEYYLLLYARVRIAAGELVGDGAVGLGVFRQVAVQEIQGDAPGLGLPYLEAHFPLRYLHFDVQFLTVVVEGGGDRQVGKIGGRVVGHLYAFAVYRLGEVALTVEQSHRHEG